MRLKKRTIGILGGACLLLAAAALSVNFFPNTVTKPLAPAVIDQGGGAVTSGAYTLFNGSCRYAMSKPVTFRNSGQQAVTLEQLAQPIGIKSVFISGGDNAEVFTGSIEPQVFLTPEFSMNQLGLTAEELTQQRTFIPSYQKIGDQIEPGETYTVYLIILIDVTPDFTSWGVLAATVRVDAIFSNDQISIIEESIPISKNVLEKCN